MIDLILREAVAHKVLVRTVARFPDETTLQDVVRHAEEVLAWNALIDQHSYMTTRVELVEEVQG